MAIQWDLSSPDTLETGVQQIQKHNFIPFVLINVRGKGKEGRRERKEREKEREKERKREREGGNEISFLSLSLPSLRGDEGCGC